jgi:hypothetical protein
MATLRTRYVNTASSGGDGTTNNTSGATAAYASLQAALTAEVAATPNLVTADVQLDILCTGSAADTAAATVTGWTTDATRYVRIAANTGQEAQSPWSTSRYRMAPAANTTPLTISQAHTRIERIQVELATGASARFGIDVGNFPGVRIVGCYIRATGAGAGTQVGIRSPVSGAGNTFHVRNTIVTGFNGTGITHTSGSGEGYLYNCTAANCGTGFNGVGGVRAKNCLEYNNTTGFGGTYHASSTNNASEDTTAPGSNQRHSQTFTFVNAAGGDFHLGSADAGARDFGSNLSADASFPFSDDFDAVVRSGTWDIGADEYVAAVTGNPWYAYRQQ